MHIYRIKFVNLPLPMPDTTLQSTEIPRPGATVTTYIPDNAPEEVTDEIVVYGIDHESEQAMGGPRTVVMDGFPLFSVDLHLAIIRCRRCGSVEPYLIKPFVEGAAEYLDFECITDALEAANQFHMDCERPICLN
jgi:hypothetical protein